MSFYFLPLLYVPLFLLHVMPLGQLILNAPCEMNSTGWQNDNLVIVQQLRVCALILFWLFLTFCSFIICTLILILFKRALKIFSAPCPPTKLLRRHCCHSIHCAMNPYCHESILPWIQTAMNPLCHESKLPWIHFTMNPNGHASMYHCVPFGTNRRYKRFFTSTSTHVHGKSEVITMPVRTENTYIRFHPHAYSHLLLTRSK